VHAQRRRALRSGGREVHRVQVAHSREKSERLGRDLRRGRRSRGQRLVGADGDDTVYRGDVATGKTTAIKMPDVKVDRTFGDDRAFYETVSDLGFNVPLPWSQGPRRMGTDKNADLLWVGNSFGSSWAKINTKTLETTILPLPDPAMQAYHIA